jgi:hypothetical protein
VVPAAHKYPLSWLRGHVGKNHRGNVEAKRALQGIAQGYQEEQRRIGELRR